MRCVLKCKDKTGLLAVGACLALAQCPRTRAGCMPSGDSTKASNPCHANIDANNGSAACLPKDAKWIHNHRSTHQHSRRRTQPCACRSCSCSAPARCHALACSRTCRNGRCRCSLHHTCFPRRHTSPGNHGRSTTWRGWCSIAGTPPGHTCACSGGLHAEGGMHGECTCGWYMGEVQLLMASAWPGCTVLEALQLCGLLPASHPGDDLCTCKACHHWSTWWCLVWVAVVGPKSVSCQTVADRCRCHVATHSARRTQRASGSTVLTRGRLWQVHGHQARNHQRCQQGNTEVAPHVGRGTPVPYAALHLHSEGHAFGFR
jgi:hypothetical protein